MLNSYDVGGTATFGIFVSAMVMSASFTTSVPGDLLDCLSGDDTIAYVDTLEPGYIQDPETKAFENQDEISNRSENEDEIGVRTIVRELKDNSGLTVAEIGRAVGVSRRSVHNWAIGNSVSPLYETRLRSLYAAIFPPSGDEEPNQGEAGRKRVRFADSSTIGERVGYRGEQRLQYSVPLADRF